MEHAMANLSRATAAAAVLGLALSMVSPSYAAISVELAKQCRALMLKAHPTHLYGTDGTAVAQRAYFRKCVSRDGAMPEAKQKPAGKPTQPATTGQGR